MAQIDKVKEQINFLKFWLSLVMASVLAVVGFCVTSYTKIDVWFLLLCLACIVVLGICAWALSKVIVRKINELKDL